MHIGNAYAALAAWLGVRSRGGKLILRIEDIDTPRVVRDADRWIMDDVRWLGLDWDGEPVYQSSRLHRYEQAVDALRGMTLNDIICAANPASESAVDCRDTQTPLLYPCFCSRADIRAASAPNEGDGFIVYPGTCRRLPAVERHARLSRGDRHSWRIAVPPSGSPVGAIGFDDLVFGPQHFDLGRQLGDVVVRRSDGLFAYQLAVSIDDLDMGVTQIVRGRDLLRSTAIQVWIRRALAQTVLVSSLQSQSHAMTVPQFAHLPLVDDTAGKRLAKRDRALDLGVLREGGVGPERVVGYCAWMLGLQAQPTPCRPSDLLDGFTWNTVAKHQDDHRCDTRDLLR